MTTRSKMFLVVDDEPDMCWALEHILNANGFPTQKALSGQEALRLMAQERFQTVFLDAKLPDFEGIDLARRIREFDPDVRIIIISGYFYGDDVKIQAILAEGLISGFISKPFLHHEVLKIINPNPKARGRDPK